MRKQNNTVTVPEDPQALAGSLAEMEVSQPAIPNPVYRWDIPSDALPGYVLPIEITDAVSVEEARTATGNIVIGGDGTEKEPGRPLTPMEKAFISATEPMVVWNTEQISLSYDGALYHNERLTRENEGYADAKRIFAEHRIDVRNPQAWVDAHIATAEALISTKTAALDRRAESLARGLERAAAVLSAVAKETGFATPEPVVAPEPDYSALTIFTNDISKVKQYPRLAPANWVETTPTEGYSEAEKRGAWLIARENGYIEQAWRGFQNPEDEAALKAIQARIKAETQE